MPEREDEETVLREGVAGRLPAERPLSGRSYLREGGLFLSFLMPTGLRRAPFLFGHSLGKNTTHAPRDTDAIVCLHKIKQMSCTNGTTLLLVELHDSVA